MYNVEIRDVLREELEKLIYEHWGLFGENIEEKEGLILDMMEDMVTSYRSGKVSIYEGRNEFPLAKVLFPLYCANSLLSDLTQYTKQEMVNHIIKEALKASNTSGLVAGNFIKTCAGEESAANPIAAARILAMRNHAKNTLPLRGAIERFWKENIDPNLSAQKAAEKILVANIVPLSHKKIAEIVSKLKNGESFIE